VLFWNISSNDEAQSAKFENEKFNGKNNFEIWKVKMHDPLVQQGVVKAPLGGKKQPATIKNEYLDEIDARVLSAIRMCLVDDVLLNIVAEKTTFGLWTKLESLYMTKYLTNKIFLKRKLYSLCMREGKKINDHLNHFITLLVQLTSMGVKFDSEDMEITLLCSFPASWDHFVTSISFITT
jgi:cell division cycle protein 20 (cofactor of APC complex)